MTTSIYVDLSLGSVGDGSSGNPFGATNWVANVTNDMIVNIRGTATYTSGFTITNTNLTIQNWVTAPFRFNFSPSESMIAHYANIIGGIIKVNSFIVNTTTDCYIISSNLAYLWGTSCLRTCWVFSSPSNGAIDFQNNCVFDHNYVYKNSVGAILFVDAHAATYQNSVTNHTSSGDLLTQISSGSWTVGAGNTYSYAPSSFPTITEPDLSKFALGLPDDGRPVWAEVVVPTAGIPDIHYAVDIFTDETGLTDEPNGIVAGTFRFVTDRPSYDLVTVVPFYGPNEIDISGASVGGTPVTFQYFEDFLLKEAVTGNPARSIDITACGSYSTDSAFSFKMRNDLKFWDYCNANSIKLTGRRVVMWCIIDDIFYQVARGRITNNPFNETDFEFAIDDDATLIHKELPPVVATPTNLPAGPDSQTGDPVPIVMGDVSKSKILKLSTSNSLVNAFPNGSIVAATQYQAEYDQFNNSDGLIKGGTFKIWLLYSQTVSVPSFPAHYLKGKYLRVTKSTAHADTDQIYLIVDNLANKRLSFLSTTMTINTSGKSFIVTDFGISIHVGRQIKVQYDAAHFMLCTVTSWNPSTGALNCTVNSATGTGTFTDWAIIVGWGSLADSMYEIEVTLATNLLDNTAAPVTEATFNSTYVYPLYNAGSPTAFKSNANTWWFQVSDFSIQTQISNFAVTSINGLFVWNDSLKEYDDVSSVISPITSGSGINTLSLLANIASADGKIVVYKKLPWTLTEVGILEQSGTVKRGSFTDAASLALVNDDSRLTLLDMRKSTHSSSAVDPTTGGNKSFQVPAGLPIVVGQWIEAYRQDITGTYIVIGQCQSYSGTTLVISSPYHIGPGTINSWTIYYTDITPDNGTYFIYANFIPVAYTTTFDDFFFALDFNMNGAPNFPQIGAMGAFIFDIYNKTLMNHRTDLEFFISGLCDSMSTSGEYVFNLIPNSFYAPGKIALFDTTVSDSMDIFTMQATGSPSKSFKNILTVPSANKNIFTDESVGLAQFRLAFKINPWTGPYWIELKEVALMGSTSIDTINGDLYTAVAGEKTGATTTDPNHETNDVYHAFMHILEDYDGIPSNLIDYGNLATERNLWHVGRVLTERKNAVDYLNELCSHSFVGMFSTRIGKRGLRAFQSFTTLPVPVASHNQNNIVRDSIENFEKSDISQLYNNFLLQYNYDPGPNKFIRAFTVANVDKFTSFPAVSTIDRLTPAYLSSSNRTIGTGTINFTIATGLNLTIGAGIAADHDSSNYVEGTISSYAIATGVVSILVTTAVGSGTFNSWNVSLLGNPTWYQCFGGLQGSPGFSSVGYAESKVIWDACRASYTVNGAVKQAQNDISELNWYIDRALFDIATSWGTGDTSSAYYLLKLLAQWTTLQKDVVSYALPINSANISLELLDVVTFNDAIYTKGADRTGWIVSIEVDAPNDQVKIRVMLQPLEIQPYPTPAVIASRLMSVLGVPFVQSAD